jgi:myosin-1
MLTSENSLLKSLFPPPDLNSKKRPLTAGTQFKNALANLMEKLLACEPHYVRCIKPNDEKRAGVLNEQRVRHQVRYLGLLENVRVRRAGFAFRTTYDRFMWRYKMTCKMTWPKWRQDAKSGTIVQILRKFTNFFF